MQLFISIVTPRPRDCLCLQRALHCIIITCYYSHHWLSLHSLSSSNFVTHRHYTLSYWWTDLLWNLTGWVHWPKT